MFSLGYTRGISQTSEKYLLSMQALTFILQVFVINIICRKIFEKSLSISVVRHPFERLVSAYQNKFVDHSSSKFAKYLKYHFHANSFAMFVKMILEQSEMKCQQMNTCQLNNHWKPFITRCAYCDVSYSIIARHMSTEPKWCNIASKQHKNSDFKILLKMLYFEFFTFHLQHFLHLTTYSGLDPESQIMTKLSLHF